MRTIFLKYIVFSTVYAHLTILINDANVSNLSHQTYINGRIYRLNALPHYLLRSVLTALYNISNESNSDYLCYYNVARHTVNFPDPSNEFDPLKASNKQLQLSGILQRRSQDQPFAILKWANFLAYYDVVISASSGECVVRAGILRVHN